MAEMDSMIHLNFHVLLDTGVKSRKQLSVVREEFIQVFVNVTDLGST